MGIKGCWTCRERKVKCESQRPQCANCIKARRLCKGYGMQLSWPRENDRRRAIFLHDPVSSVEGSGSCARGFSNTSFWDISLAEALEQIQIPARFLRTMQIPRPVYLSPVSVDTEQSQLLGFFNESRSLILGPTDEEALSNFILRVAFSDESSPNNPVLQAVFALASLQLDGSIKSFRYKHSVVSALRASIDWFNEKTLLQNLMATMLLYHYELSLGSNSKGHWVRYLCAVKNIINESPAMQKLIREEYSVFFDWVHYHEVLGEFTIRHWERPYQGCGYAPISKSIRAIHGNVSQTEESIGCPSDVLELVTQTCRVAINNEPADMPQAYAQIERLSSLETNISLAVGDYGPIYEEFMMPISRKTMVANLHRLASLIYVNRSVHNMSGNEFHHKRLIREGVMLLTEMKTCENAWPLFIIACEAADDEQRLAILDVFEQSQQDRRRRSSHVHFIQHMVEAVWNQLDLNVENDVDFMTIFNAVVGGVPFTPPFA